MRLRSPTSLSRFYLNKGSLYGRFSGGRAARLIGSNFVGQLIGLSALPALTRLYGPSSWGGLATYAATIASIAPVAAWRFDAAIPSARSQREAIELLFLAMVAALISATVVTAILLLTQLVFKEFIPVLRGSFMITLIFLGTIAAAWSNSLIYLGVRSKLFGVIGRVRIVQPIIGATVPVIMYFLSISGGLLLGHISNSSAGTSWLFRKQWRVIRRTWSATSAKRLFRTAEAHSAFPRQTVIEELARNLSLQVPIILIAASLGAAEAGIVFLSMRILGTPQVVVANSVAQVFYANCPQYAIEGTLEKEVLKLTKILTLYFAVPMLLLGWLSVPLAPMLFGPTWSSFGKIFVLMTPWYSLRVLVTAITPALYVTNRQRTAKNIFLAGLIMHVFPTWVGISLKDGNPVLWLTAGAGVFQLTALMSIIYSLSSSKRRVRHYLFRLTAFLIFSYVVGGMMMVLITGRTAW